MEDEIDYAEIIPSNLHKQNFKVKNTITEDYIKKIELDKQEPILCIIVPINKAGNKMAYWRCAVQNVEMKFHQSIRIKNMNNKDSIALSKMLSIEYL